MPTEKISLFLPYFSQFNISGAEYYQLPGSSVYFSKELSLPY